MDTTDNLQMPYLMPSQAQKHVTHNEALGTLDALVQLAVADRDLAASPASPVNGSRYIVAAGATGEWAGKSGQIAHRLDGAWSFRAPRVGWVSFVIDENRFVIWSGSAWADCDAAIRALQNLTLLGLGTTADSANPFAAKLNKALWTAKTAGEGGDGDLRYTLNKETSSDVLSLLMQTGYSGRAELGLVGDDNVTLKVSGDGSTWTTALTVDKSTGLVAIAANPTAALGAATKQYVDTQRDTRIAKSGDTMTGALVLPASDPLSGNEAARKAYVDAKASSGALPRTGVNDAAYTISAGDRVVAVTALTAARTLTLPAASAFAQGAQLVIVDESGACSVSNALTIAATGSDTINGASSIILSSAFAYLKFESNGSNKWTVVGQRFRSLTSVFTSTGSYTIPVWARRLRVSCVAGGGGGASGAAGTNAANRAGGGGGGSGGRSDEEYDVTTEITGNVLTFAVGAGGAGGAGVTGTNSGNDGAAGGNTTLSDSTGPIVYATAGLGGTAGSTVAGAAGVGGLGNSAGNAGGPGNPTAVGGGGTRAMGAMPGGGGGGGGAAAVGSTFAGGLGAIGYFIGGTPRRGNGGTAGAAGGGAGGAGTASLFSRGAGGGGGGGGSAIGTTNGGIGGDGAAPGGGGGGGGGCRDTATSGAGGAGGAGAVVIIALG